jgi:hypothetical protein
MLRLAGPQGLSSLGARLASDEGDGLATDRVGPDFECERLPA